ncbi:copper homeostasis protein CutC [Daejeonella sp.]|uniref:copper homeostasis protein CutC n=1 Tax=Daejeonella sp. TaxID=2805397 RepID=UPI0039830E25
MKYILEICAGSLGSALAAQQGGADRVELCDNLYEGGTTPSSGMIKTCKSLLNIPLFPIIRPRGGDFVYTDQEFEVMKQDVLCCLELACEGIVFGILLPDGSVDIERCSELVKLSGDMQITFHRAFDRCNDHKQGLEDIIRMGFHRVLTSGGMENAEDAIPELSRLIHHANGRICMMPGSGITPNNLSKIKATGALEFHTTAKTKIDHVSGIHPNNLDTPYLFQTDVLKVREMRQILNAATAGVNH